MEALLENNFLRHNKKWENLESDSHSSSLAKFSRQAGNLNRKFISSSARAGISSTISQIYRPTSDKDMNF